MKKYFSLVEMMVAIFIISLLTTILSYYMTNTLDDSRAAKVREDLKKLKEIAFHYKADLLETRKKYCKRRINNGFNFNIQKNIGSFCSSGPKISDPTEYITEGLTMNILIEMKYIESAFYDPWGREYSFSAVSNRPGFEIETFTQKTPYNVPESDPSWKPAFSLYVGCLSPQMVEMELSDEYLNDTLEYGYWRKVGQQKY